MPLAHDSWVCRVTAVTPLAASRFKAHDLGGVRAGGGRGQDTSVLGPEAVLTSRELPKPRFHPRHI